MEYVRCTLCSADQPRSLFRLRNDRYLKALGIVPPTSVKVMCGVCGHIYSNPQLDSNEISRLYRDVYRSPALGYSQERPSDEYLYWKTLKARRDHRWITAHLPDSVKRGVALEIGCAEGLLLSMLAKDGWSVLGVEATPPYAAHACEAYGIEVVGAPFEEAELSGRKFDLVIALKVLEHTKGPLEFLAKIRRVLDPKGMLYLTVPNALRPDESLSNFLASPHLSLFTAATLQRMLGKSGFFTSHFDDGFGFLSALAQPVELFESPVEAVSVTSRRGIRRAILRYRVRSQVNRAFGRIRQGLKRGLYGLVGAEAGDLLWQRIRRWSGLAPRGE